MAIRKKRKSPRAAKAKMLHDSESKEHGGIRITIGVVGPIKRIRRLKSRGAQKSTPKEVKAFLKWAVAQL